MERAALFVFVKMLHILCLVVYMFYVYNVYIKCKKKNL